jgi:predicted amidophosphoribosyltransferase
MKYEGHNMKFQNLLIKTQDVKTHKMNWTEKEKFYSENKLYEFREDLAGMGYLRGKKVILVDDVVTQGYAAEQCLKALSNQGADDLCFYSVGTTKRKR